MPAAVPPTKGAGMLRAEVRRNGFAESVHLATAVIVDPAGEVVASWGDPEAPVMARSSNKPMQAIAMLRGGLKIEGQLLALACASHSGEDFHLDGVKRLLGEHGLSVSDLRNTPDYPLDDAARKAMIAAGVAESSLAQNCSGKHAAMLATCAVNGWDLPTYLAPEHPLQVLIERTIEELTGESMAATGVDGCGAPLVAFSLSGLARVFGGLQTSGEPAQQAVAAAMSTWPEWVSGTTRDSLALVRKLPGALAKEGAEGVYAVGLPDGTGIALKVHDGNQRPRPALMNYLLESIGYLGLADVGAAESMVKGGGKPVGSVVIA